MTENEWRSLLGGLRELREVESPDMRPVVLPEIGLADRYGKLDSPLGALYVAYNDRGISAVMGATSPPDFERTFLARFGRTAFPVDELPPAVLRARADGGVGRRSLRFDLRGLSPFEQAVLLKALEIPRGEIRPYNWIAREIGRPRAVRAVGSALAKNPIPVLIPCHRVVRGDGTIGQYGLGGPVNKRVILEAEGVDVQGLQSMARVGVRFVGSDTTHIYCHPTCRNARRITPHHRQELRTMQQAESSGFRPCKVCRPA